MRILLAILLALAAPAWAEDLPVDVELALMVDVSRSMSPNELEIQRRGYAEALVSAEVMAAIRRGAYGRVAITYVEWAGAQAQRVVAPWALIERPEDAAAFAAQITAHFDPALRRTSISGAVDDAMLRFRGNGFAGLRRVIDISGDGPNNEGRPAPLARDDAVAAGFVINGLPLMTKEGMGAQWHLDDLDRYYADCVIGGPGAFVIPVHDWADFPAAVRRKLVLELAGAAPRVTPAVQHLGPKYDCLIGEKIWRRMRRYWDEP